MTSITHQPQLDLLTDRVGALDNDVSAQIWGLLTTLHPKHDLTERRRDSRYAFPYLVHLTPVADDGVTPQDEPIVVVGKHLSERGLGFYHPEPLPHRRVIATLEAGDGHQLSFLVELTWCRFTDRGWYESGGRFLQSVSSPPEPPA